MSKPSRCVVTNVLGSPRTQHSPHIITKMRASPLPSIITADLRMPPVKGYAVMCLILSVWHQSIPPSYVRLSFPRHKNKRSRSEKKKKWCSRKRVPSNKTNEDESSRMASAPMLNGAPDRAAAAAAHSSSPCQAPGQPESLTRPPARCPGAPPLNEDAQGAECLLGEPGLFGPSHVARPGVASQPSPAEKSRTQCLVGDEPCFLMERVVSAWQSVAREEVGRLWRRRRLRGRSSAAQCSAAACLFGGSARDHLLRVMLT